MMDFFFFNLFIFSLSNIILSQIGEKQAYTDLRILYIFGGVEEWEILNILSFLLHTEISPHCFVFDKLLPLAVTLFWHSIPTFTLWLTTDHL